MDNPLYDPIVAEVRKNREELFAECDYDVKKLYALIESKWPEMEAAGFRYETKEAREARIAWKRKQEEEERRMVAN